EGPYEGGLPEVVQDRDGLLVVCARSVEVAELLLEAGVVAEHERLDRAIAGGAQAREGCLEVPRRVLEHAALFVVKGEIGARDGLVPLVSDLTVQAEGVLVVPSCVVEASLIAGEHA